MKLEQIIEARIQYEQYVATIQYVVGISLLVIALIALIVRLCAKRFVQESSKDYNMSFDFFSLACVIAGLFFGALFSTFGFFEHRLARMKATAEISNYNLVELKR
jgi:nitrate reductase gamma subunit